MSHIIKFWLVWGFFIEVQMISNDRHGISLQIKKALRQAEIY